MWFHTSKACQWTIPEPDLQIYILRWHGDSHPAPSDSRLFNDVSRISASLDDALQTSCRIKGGNGTVLGSIQGHGSLANNNQINEEQKLPSSWFMKALFTI